MSIVISTAVVLSEVPEGLSLDHPLIGWHNVVTSTNIVADTEEVNYPASNLANPDTHLEWRAEDDSEQYLTVTTGYVDQIDYVAIAKHNLSSGSIPISIGYFDTSSPPVWTELVEEVMLSDDGPALFRFEAQSLATVKIKLGSGTTEARIAVVHVGKLLVIERKVYAGHISITDGIKVNVANGRSESGNFLGRIILGQWRETTVPLAQISPDWFRTTMRPFLKDGRDKPFFFAWRPETYPMEVGYGWLIEDPTPTPTPPSNRIAFDLKVSGIA
jgi:hypothetical protein